MSQSNVEKRKLLPPFPNGWYTLGLSRELPPGGVLSLQFMGQEIVLINAIITRATFNGFAHDTQQDFVIWQHKRYVQPPILAEGDGPIGRYRLWAKQFYRGADAALV